MEKLNQYRDNLAKKLKTEKDPNKRKNILGENKTTLEYNEAWIIHGLKKELDKIYGGQSPIKGTEKNIDEILSRILNLVIETQTIENTFNQISKYIRELPEVKKIPLIKNLVEKLYCGIKNILDGNENTQEEVIDKFIQKNTKGGYFLNQYILPLMKELPQEIAKKIIEYPNQRGQFFNTSIDSYGVFKNWDSFKTEPGFKEWAVQQVIEHGDPAYWVSLYLKNYEGITKETQQKLVELNLTQERIYESINMIPKMLKAGFSPEELPKTFQNSGVYLELKNLTEKERKNLSPDQWFEVKQFTSTKHLNIGKDGETLYDRLKKAGYEIEWVEFIKKWSYCKETGYTSSMYKNKEKNLLITIDYNREIDTNFSKLSDYELKNKNYVNETKKACKKYKIPFDVGIIIGAEGVKILSEKLSEIKNLKDNKNIHHCFELSLGIGRKKNAIKEILGEDIYKKLGVSSMGQKKSFKLANYLLELIEANSLENKNKQSNT